MYMTAREFYSSRIAALKTAQALLTKKKHAFGFLRLGLMLAIVAAVYLTWPLGLPWVFVAVAALAFLFVRVLYKDLANKEAIAHNNLLERINEDELKALNHEYFHFDNGQAYLPKDHYYANDMDIFGHASLYQFVNRTCSEMGGRQLADWLLAPAAADEILQRQEAVKALRKNMVWLQKLQAFGKENPVTINTRERLQYWLYEPLEFHDHAAWKWLRYLLPVLSTGITLLTIFGWVPMNVFYAAMLLMAFVALPPEKKIGKLHNRLSKMVDELDTLSKSIAAIEGADFNSTLLQQLQQQYRHENIVASQQIASLRKILDRLDVRLNLVLMLPLNLLFLWDIQQALSLNKWKKKNTAEVRHWFDTLGKFEALGSFAVLHFNQPGWAFPQFASEYFFFEATGMGHPLLAPEKSILNPVHIDHNAAVMLVTGSNMAGKSTYLRSAGTNVVLAMAGAPVCAQQFTISPVQLISSMRIADNLEESTSTFYAELKKLKTVIDKVKAHEQIFILLDEILRGTNSLDRHTGTEALIRQLVREQSAAILATHDLDLTGMQQTYPQNISNYHFDVQVHNEELFFDYKLKPGVCNSLNASILMKKIGIEIGRNEE